MFEGIISNGISYRFLYIRRSSAKFLSVGCYDLFFATVEYYTAIFPPDTQSTYAKKVIKAINGKHVKVLEVLRGK